MTPRVTWAAYLVLLAFSIPWYFPAGSGEPLVLGFPLWCLVSLICYVLVAALTVWRLDRLWEAQMRDLESRLRPANARRTWEGERQ